MCLHIPSIPSTADFTSTNVFRTTITATTTTTTTAAAAAATNITTTTVTTDYMNSNNVNS